MSRTSAAARDLNNLSQMLDEVADQAVARMIAAVGKAGVIPPRRFLTNAEAAQRLGIQAETLSKMRSAKEGPQWTGSGHFTRYEVSAIDEWFAKLPRKDAQ
jgi:predicted DNA-binding transcriptional regulator AlpA